VTEGLEGKNRNCAFQKMRVGEEVEEVETKKSYCSSRRTTEVVKEAESKNRIHFLRRMGVVEVVEGGLGVMKGSCFVWRLFFGNDTQYPLLAMKSTLKCDISTNRCLGATAVEAVEMVDVQDNCSSRRTPPGMDAYQPALRGRVIG
jgi:hypothetical protein